MSTMPARVGVIGCGNISAIYFKICQALPAIDIVACADLDIQRARARAAEFGVPHARGVDELLADPAIDIVLNLTIPGAHAAVAAAALEAGKHVYNEKPLALTRDDGRRVLDLAHERGLRVGCAPDTFLGGGLQTCRRLIDDGAIGEPVAATAFMMSHGHEHWHPDPAFYYQPGGGPMFDMGPYYLTALIALMGPMRRVTGSTRTAFAERTITSQPRHGEKIAVRTPTHIAGVLDFVNGAVATIVTSFDVWAAHVPAIEIYGTEGSLSVPDPNTFGGPVWLCRAGERDWHDVALTHGYTENCRGIGLADMALALKEGRRPHRASGELAYHVLDIMQAFDEASGSGRHIEPRSTCARPAAMPANFP